MSYSVKSNSTTHNLLEYSDLKSYLLSMVYPVGSIYISTNNVNPSSFLGGNWYQYGQGRTLIGAGTTTDSNSTSKTFTVGSTGGEYTHKLTVSELASHTHWQNSNPSSAEAQGYGLTQTGGFQNRPVVTSTSATANVAITNTGSNEYHNNIQPYIVVYFFRRVS